MPDAEALERSATQLLQELIRFDTVNPPGNETIAARLLQEYLEGSGVECELYAIEPERANLVARMGRNPLANVCGADEAGAAGDKDLGHA